MKRLIPYLVGGALLALAALALYFFYPDPGRAPEHSVTVADVRGQCWTLAGTNGIRYAVKADQGKALGLKPGQRVTIRGKVSSKQDCAAAVLLTADMP